MENNIYYSPEKFGLEQIASWDFSDGSYCFDYRVVWRKQNGELVTARDSGCSCPSPFEDEGVKDLVSFSKEELRQEAIDATKSEFYGGDSLSDILAKIEALPMGVTK